MRGWEERQPQKQDKSSRRTGPVHTEDTRDGISHPQPPFWGSRVQTPTRLQHVGTGAELVVQPQPAGLRGLQGLWAGEALLPHRKRLLERIRPPASEGSCGEESPELPPASSFSRELETKRLGVEAGRKEVRSQPHLRQLK